ncbi:hypothetical protein M758_4G003000 [Ceratodon purpureus]|nr:hypothetical protein M758_4G003000 [Ceratodon purpureus]
MWFEEMINNRDKSVVRDLRWSADGQKICIVYEDGHVVLGNVDGNRLWGKTLDVQLHLVEWSPDSRLILFCTALGTCQIHDLKGNFVAQLGIRFTEREFAPTAVIVAIDWYNGLEGYSDPNAPSLALAFQLGRIQLMRHEMDEEPILLELQMMITSIKWSPDGEVVGVVGSDVSTNGKAPSSIVQLFSHTGMHLRTLRVPGTRTSALSWEGGGLRLALAVDSYIYLANIRPEYKWAFFGSSTCMYSFKKRDHLDHSVMFWDIGTGERVRNQISMC